MSYSHIDASAINVLETIYDAGDALISSVWRGFPVAVSRAGLKFYGIRRGGRDARLNLVYQGNRWFRPGFAENRGKFIFYSGTKNHGRTLFSSKWHDLRRDLYHIGSHGTRGEALKWRRLPRTGKREAGALTKNELSAVYRDYIACLNGQDWPALGMFVADQVCHNGRQIGLAGYRDMLEGDYRDIPNLRFNVQLLISDPPFVASRLLFDCAPAGMFLGLPVNGRTISFTENVFYEFRGGKIANVWSVIDKPAIEAQL